MTRKSIPAGLWISISILLAGCSLRDPLAAPQTRGNVWPDRFRIVSAKEAPAAPEGYAPHFQLTRQGRQKDAMRLIAPVSIRAGIDDVQGAALLRTTAAAVFNLGDGFRMDVLLGAPGREEKTVYRRTFNAGLRAADRAWIPLEIPLDMRGFDGGYIEIRVSGGPRGDLTADWLALADFEILPLMERR